VREEAGQRILQSMVWGFPLRLNFMKPEWVPTGSLFGSRPT